MFRFAAKVGIASGAVYYISEQGVWKDSETTSKLYCDVKDKASPYFNQAKAALPFELPTIPKTDNLSQLGVYYWNSGVKAVFRFILNSPTHITNWSKSAYNSMIEFANSPQPPASDSK